uniref:Uncharacterized protein n=1 Tax=Rhodosorus marinus TaxID=101924 RepID=A0A7S2ZU53_9RHOD|mmetsp:Transcript_32722/g.128551  ORF Transcript_32722/g.128551 Transcript_32722/m.128551 type:complete len:289 (+) Transcript_32722:937-1803(+)
MFELRRAVLRSSLNRTQEKKEDGRTESFEEKNKDRHKYLSRKVRRVTVPAYWNGDFGEFFLPTYTQEPSTKQLLFIFNGTEDLEGAEPLQMKLYDDVAFAAVSAFFPGGIVIPSTFDILRLDLLTITGLIASITSFFTRIDNKFASWVAAGTLLQYLVRVFVNFINITAQYKERRGRQQLDSISAQGNAVLLVLQDYVQDLEVKTGLLLLGSPLLANGSQARADDLRAEAEQFLEDHVGEEVDLRRSVPRVLRILREGGFVDLETGFVRLTDKSNLLMRVENGMDQTL